MFRSGLIGRGITASRSPWLHEQEARAQGIDLTYALFDFEVRKAADVELGPLLERLSDEGFCGVNVTYPFKQAVIPLLDELDESAASVGAVNTVEMRDGRTIGHNTDMTGFRENIVQGLPGASLDRVLQLGAGGAGAAVASALLSIGVTQLVLSDVSPERAGDLAARLNMQFGADRATVIPFDAIDTTAIDGIVNATPMGMTANPSPPLRMTLVDSLHWVADIVYVPLETEFLHAARTRGCRVLDGSGMVVNQAAGAFEIFTGRVADRARMKRSFADFKLGDQSSDPLSARNAP